MLYYFNSLCHSLSNSANSIEILCILTILQLFYTFRTTSKVTVIGHIFKTFREIVYKSKIPIFFWFVWKTLFLKFKMFLNFPGVFPIKIWCYSTLVFNLALWFTRRFANGRSTSSPFPSSSSLRKYTQYTLTHTRPVDTDTYSPHSTRSHTPDQWTQIHTVHT